MPVEGLTPEEEAEFTAMQTGTAPADPPESKVEEPKVEEPKVEEPKVEELKVEEPKVEEPEAPKPGEPGSKHRADGTFKSADELAADAEAIVAAEAAAVLKPEKQKMVPHEALHAERVLRQQAAQRAQILETRMNAMLAAQAGKPPAPAEMPDLATNPMGYMAQLESRLAAFEASQQEDQQTAAIDAAFTQDEETFKLIQPDYDDAGEHYLKSRYAELSQFYPAQQIQQMLFEEVRQIATQSWQAGRPAAQTVYALAMARGYKPGQVATPEPTPTLQPTPTPPAPAPNAAEIVEAARNGQANSRSLSGGAGGAVATQLNAEAVLNMTDEAFDDYLKTGTKGADARFAALFG